MSKKITLEGLDKRLRKLEAIQEEASQSRYKFENIFEYKNEKLFPLYDIRLMGIVYKKNYQIKESKSNSWSINWKDSNVLFSKLGKDIIGHWDNKNKILEIAGFGY